METYSSFASVYDNFMQDVPYQTWANNIIKILKKHNINSGLIADLGCGTANITEILHKYGYDMIGIDNSIEMLNIAIEKTGSDILYLCQDIREFELYGTCRAIISTCDSINYILDFDDLLKVFKLVNTYLDNDGIFIFDCNTLYKYEHILADNTFAENTDMGSFIWENNFDNNTKLNEYDLSLYIKIPESNLYDRKNEFHIQRAYTLEELKAAIKLSGLEFLEVKDADTFDEINDFTERYLFTVSKKVK